MTWRGCSVKRNTSATIPLMPVSPAQTNIQLGEIFASLENCATRSRRDNPASANVLRALGRPSVPDGPHGLDLPLRTGQSYAFFVRRLGPHHTVFLRLRHRSNAPMAKTSMLEAKPSQTLQSDGSNSCPAGCRAARAHQTPAGNSAMPNHMRASAACRSFIRANAA